MRCEQPAQCPAPYPSCLTASHQQPDVDCSPFAICVLTSVDALDEGGYGRELVITPDGELENVNPGGGIEVHMLLNQPQTPPEVIFHAKQQQRVQRV